MMGWSGINIGANPKTINFFKKYRPADKNIWTAIIPKADYENGVQQISLILPSKSDNASGIATTGTVNSQAGTMRGFSENHLVPAISIGNLIENLGVSKIDYLNIDIEGHDEAILQEIDLSTLSPTVVTSKITLRILKNSYNFP